jgi:hypothetical protein
VAAGLLALLAPAVAGCSGAGLGVNSVASYAPANAIVPVGYFQKPTGEQQFQVGASGTEATPTERIEKIATARAAEIGVDQKLPYFKVANVTRGMSCTRKMTNAKYGDMPATHHPTVILDVVYAKSPVDANYRASAATFSQLKAELESEVVAPETAAQVAASSRAQCGAT